MHIDNTPLDNMLARRSAPRGRTSEHPSSRLILVMKIIVERHVEMVCGKLYQYSSGENRMVHMASDSEDSISKLYRFGCIERSGPRLILTEKGWMEMGRAKVVCTIIDKNKYQHEED